MRPDDQKPNDGDLPHDDALNTIVTRDIGAGVATGVAVGDAPSPATDQRPDAAEPTSGTPSPTIPDVAPESTARR